MLYNNIDLSDYMRIIDVRGRGVTEQELTTIKVQGYDNVYVTGRRKPRRYLEIDYEIRAGNKDELRNKIDAVSGFIETKSQVPIVFNDESGMIYYGEYAGVQENKEYHHIGIHRGTIFILRDNFKYGEEKTISFDESTVIENKCTAEADPIIELTATEKSTFAMISDGETYNLIGTPADDDVQEVDTKTLVLSEDGSTIDEWSDTQDMAMVSNDTNIDGLNGVMGTDGAGIRVESRGSPTQKQNGPAVFKELDTAIQDFEIESTFDIISRREIENWRMMIYFLDENLNPIGHVGVKDNSRIYKRRVALSQLGQHNQGVRLIGDSSYIEDNARDTTLFYLRFKREGKNFKAYIAHWRNQRHDTIWEASYNDIDNQFQGKLKYITLFLGRFQDRVTPNRMRINKVEVSELTTVTEDQTPYVIYEGDVVTFDHKNEDILINGEARNDLKNFGASYFKLKKGFNTIVVSPDTFESEIKFRERFR